MNTTFRDAVSFRGFGLENWDVRKVETMQSMFDSAASFQGNLSGWQISRVVDFSWMFIGCTSFRGDLSRWNTSSAETMASMVRHLENGKCSSMHSCVYN